MEAALKGVDDEIQAQLWGHLRSNSVTSAGGSGGGGGGGGGGAASALAAPAAGVKTVSSDSPTGTILNLAHRARVTPGSALHAAALALHCLLMAEGCICTGQDDKAGAIKGFAAPVRDVSEEKLVPDRWDADPTAVSFRYRRPEQPGKVYLFKTAGSGASPAPVSTSTSSSSLSAGGKRGPTQFFLGEKGGEILSADVDLEPLERCGSPNFFGSESFFETLFSVFRREVLSPVMPCTDSPSRAAPASASASAPRSTGDGGIAVPAGDERPSPSAGKPHPVVPHTGTEDYEDPLRVGPPRFAGPPGVGPTPFIPGRGGDFGGDLFPSGVGGPAGGGSGGLPGPGGLLGPGHPMFGGGGGAGYMEPRYDPYGPPMPGQPWGPGVPGREGGRGGPAQGGPRGPPGGPDNDHLRPPGGSGNMFF
ncbi:unnamed protein product [Pylaiella littoralis]